MTRTLTLDNEAACLAQSDLIFERMRAAAAQRPGRFALASVLDAEDLDALQRTTGTVLAFLSVGSEEGLDATAEDTLRTVLVVLYSLMDTVVTQLDPAAAPGKETA
jgi:hypothetical protein